MNLQAALDYTLARKIDRYQAQDVMATVFEGYVELSGDGRVSDDFCLKGGLARIGGAAVVVMGTVKGHTPGDMQAANYGKASKAAGGRGGGGGGREQNNNLIRFNVPHNNLIRFNVPNYMYYLDPMFPTLPDGMDARNVGICVRITCSILTDRRRLKITKSAMDDLLFPTPYIT